MIKLKDGAYNPASVHLFSPTLFAGYWAGFRESLVADGTLARKDKEVLGSFISLANECKFCAHSHLMFAEAQGACECSSTQSYACQIICAEPHCGCLCFGQQKAQN